MELEDANHLRLRPLPAKGDRLVFESANRPGVEEIGQVAGISGETVSLEPGQLRLSAIKEGDRVWKKRWDRDWEPGCDEAPLTSGLTEGRQPLSGWLIGPLTWREGTARAIRWEAVLEEKDLPNAWQDRLPLPPEQMRAPLYLLATRQGLVAVADALLDQYEAENEHSWPRPIARLIDTRTARGARFRFGQWVDLTGRPNHPGQSVFEDPAARSRVPRQLRWRSRLDRTRDARID